MKLYNSRTRKIEEFKSLTPGEVKMYTCGPTAYDYMHIGNLRTAFFTDTLKRNFILNGYKVTHVMNITDFGHLVGDGDNGEDKMTLGLKRDGLPRTLLGMQTLAKKYADLYNQDLHKLNISLPDKEPFASEYIPEYIELIKLLDKKGFIYKTSDGIYFDTSKDKNYGAMALLDRKKDDQSRIGTNNEKRNPTDFAVWKFGDNPESTFESEFGRGFPGWHIECSGMAKKFLGTTFDIHTGGTDLLPVHHINEIAQSENAHGEIFCNFFCHGEMLNIKNEKMSKSKSNYLILNSIIDANYSPLALRYLFLQTHYRQNLNFSWESLEASQNALTKLQNKIKSLTLALSKGEGKVEINEEYKNKFLEKLDNDLNTAQALALTWTLLKDKEIPDSEKLGTILYFDKVFSLNL